MGNLDNSYRLEDVIIKKTDSGRADRTSSALGTASTPQGLTREEIEFGEELDRVMAEVGVNLDDVALNETVAETPVLQMANS